MALGGGTFESFNKTLPGVYFRFNTQYQTVTESDRGVVAGGIVSDWAPEGEIFYITAKEFADDPESVTGYPYNDPKNTSLRELFKNANTLIGYKLNSGSVAAKAEGILAAKTGSVGNRISVVVTPNIIDESKYDVITYLDGVQKDEQTVPGITPLKNTLAKGAEVKGETVETAAVVYEVSGNTVKATIQNKPEGYDVRYSLKSESDVVIAETPGRLWVDNEGDVYTLHFTPQVTDKTIKLEIALIKQQKGAKKQVISTLPITNTVDEDPENRGADGSALKDNDYVKFDGSIIKESAGINLTGGRSGSLVNVASYNNMLNAIEGQAFNILFCDSTDTTVKSLVVEYTKRLNEQVGQYFQTVLYDKVDADYENVVSIYNAVTPVGDVKESGLVYWLSGLMSNIALGDEATNTVYDGELEINTNISQAKLETLLNSGNFVFHQTALDEVRTLVDVNTLQTLTEKKGTPFQNNKTIRVINIFKTRANRMLYPQLGHLNQTELDRAVIQTIVCRVLEQISLEGGLSSFNESSDVVVTTIDGQRDSVAITVQLAITGNIRKIYITGILGA